MEMFQYWLVGLQAAAVNKDLFLDDLLGLSEGFKKKARLSSVRCGAGLMLTRQDAHCARSVAEGKKKTHNAAIGLWAIGRVMQQSMWSAIFHSWQGFWMWCSFWSHFVRAAALFLSWSIACLIGWFIPNWSDIILTVRVLLCWPVYHVAQKKKKLTLNALLLYKSVRSDYLFLFSCIYEWIIYLFWIKMDNCWL